MTEQNITSYSIRSLVLQTVKETTILKHINEFVVICEIYMILNFQYILFART